MRTALLLLLAGCAKSYPATEAYYPPPAPPPPGISPVIQAREPTATDGAVAAERMVHYAGWARLRATRVQEAVLAVGTLAVREGGRIEQMSGNTITIRVPVARFDAVWKEALGLGDLLDQSLAAEDVTEAFLALDLRAKTLTTTHDRLVALLAKAEDEEDKLLLLREIQRTTEQLDQLQSQLRALRGLAELSRITIEVVPREAFVANQGTPIDGFGWIDQLSPFNRWIGPDDKRVPLPPAEGMVVLSEKGQLVAESPEGVVLWTGRVKNEPRADAAFWVDALSLRLKGGFTAVNQVDRGPWRCAVFTSGDETAYTWDLCVQVDPDAPYLWLAEAYYPDEASHSRYQPVVEASLRGGSS